MEPINVRRKILFSSVCAICHEVGFTHAEKAAVETLLEMLQSLLGEIGRTSRSYCELGGRTEPNVSDIDIALIVLGINIDTIPGYGKRMDRKILPPLSQAPKQATPKILQAGEKKPLSPYIPDYFPPFPDAHAYIRTPTYKQPVTEYEAIREKSATQKRDVEKALTRFMAKTGENSLTHSLFPDEQLANLYPLIELKLQSNVYLEALLPKDQIFEDEEEDDKQKREKEKPKKSTKVDENGEQIKDDSSANKSESTPADAEVLDNPYLREPKTYTPT